MKGLGFTDIYHNGTMMVRGYNELILLFFSHISKTFIDNHENANLTICT